MTLADVINGFYKGKTVIVNMCVHDNATGDENWVTLEKAKDDVDAFTYTELYNSQVVMFEALKKNTLKIWTYREIN